jgi:chromosome segregation ATPase
MFPFYLLGFCSRCSFVCTTLQVSLLEKKAANAQHEEERARNAVLTCENQHQAVMNKIRGERDAFEKSMEEKTAEIIVSQQSLQRELGERVRLAANQLCNDQVAQLEQVSRELTLRQNQVEGMSANIATLQTRFATLAGEKQQLAEKLKASLESQNMCTSLLEKTEEDLVISQRQCSQLKRNIVELGYLKNELDQDKEILQSRIVRLESKASELEASKITLQQELELVKSNKSAHIEQQAHKLKDLMKSIALQNGKLQEKQRLIEEKEAELALCEQNVRDETEKNEELYRLVQEERNDLKVIQRDMDDEIKQQDMKERQLIHTEERLNEMERKLVQKHEESKTSQQRMKDLAIQLQLRNEEVIKQRQILQDRMLKCDEYESRLSEWEQQLDEMSRLMEGKNDEFST